MKKITSIGVAQLLAPNINSRDVAIELRSAVKAKDAKFVDLDFSDVTFISRSAAHELLQMKNDFKYLTASKEKVIAFVNTHDNVSEMLRIVAANRALPKEREISFDPKRISIASILKELTA